MRADLLAQDVKACRLPAAIPCAASSAASISKSSTSLATADMQSVLEVVHSGHALF